VLCDCAINGSLSVPKSCGLAGRGKQLSDCLLQTRCVEVGHRWCLGDLLKRVLCLQGELVELTDDVTIEHVDFSCEVCAEKRWHRLCFHWDDWSGHGDPFRSVRGRWCLLSTLYHIRFRLIYPFPVRPTHPRGGAPPEIICLKGSTFR